MDSATLVALVEDLRTGRVTADEAARRLRRMTVADLGYARVDHDRVARQGRPEAVYGPGKTPAQCAGIVGELLEDPRGGPVVLSRADDAQMAVASAANPGAVVTAGTVVWRPAPPRTESVLILTAGTADLPVAEECAATLRAFGFAPRVVADVGVAGLHRLLARLDDLESADAVVVVAGMEGALASVVGGLCAAPVVAVPTSVGYGAALEGVTALLAMLSSCASGVTVVGIDNGFGAACAVARLWPPSPPTAAAATPPAPCPAADPQQAGPPDPQQAGPPDPQQAGPPDPPAVDPTGAGPWLDRDAPVTPAAEPDPRPGGATTAEGPGTGGGRR